MQLRRRLFAVSKSCGYLISGAHLKTYHEVLTTGPWSWRALQLAFIRVIPDSTDLLKLHFAGNLCKSPRSGHTLHRKDPNTLSPKLS
jgi:hypothetical protein